MCTWNVESIERITYEYKVINGLSESICENSVLWHEHYKKKVLLQYENGNEKVRILE